MKINRKKFLTLTGLAGVGMMTGKVHAEKSSPFQETHSQKFNMHAYAAPKLDTVRVGFIGVGSRGSGTVERLARIEGVDIKALCDVVPERVSAAADSIKDYSFNPDSYSGSQHSWKKVCDREDIDLILISTPWHLHTPMAVYAMEQGKHAATEVPSATTIEECWQLVETSERTSKHCMMLSNSCYGDFELTTLNIA